MKKKVYAVNLKAETKEKYEEFKDTYNFTSFSHCVDSLVKEKHDKFLKIKK